jgi:hypothetical protein
MEGNEFRRGFFSGTNELTLVQTRTDSFVADVNVLLTLCLSLC